MRLETLVLNNFRNYLNASVKFNADIICIVGENGEGKTNLIDAIYYLMLTKSSLNNVDAQNINHDENYFFLKAQVKKQGKKYQLLVSYERGKKKIVKVNDATYEKLSDHIGNFPVVLIAPDDVQILLGGSEERRKFFDGTLSQINTEYFNDLIAYQRYLKQRNNALKKFADSGKPDFILLDHYDEHLIKYGNRIHQVRNEHLEGFLEDFNYNYALISDHKEKVGIMYNSDMGQTFAPAQKARKKDLLLQRTTWGIHKDDFDFLIDGKPVKKFASQGQRKSFLTALKLAQFDYISKTKGFKPVLLLDDIFDKLDNKRISQLLDMISKNRFGQTFFTDARAENTEMLFKNKNINFQLIKIANGLLKTD